MTIAVMKDADPLIQTGNVHATAAQIRLAIQQHVIGQVRSGAWPVGHRIDTDMALARHFATSVSNASQAVRWLQSQGIVKRHRRRGTFVVRMPDADAGSVVHERKARTVHVLLPESGRSPGMHWNRSTFEQIESVLNEKQLQVEYCPLPDRCTPEELGTFVRGMPRGQSHAMVILLGLSNARPDGKRGELHSLEPYVESLLDYAGRICWLNRAGRPLNTWPHDAVSFSPFNEGMAVGQYMLENDVQQAIIVTYAPADWSRRRTQGIRMMVRASGEAIKCRMITLKDPDDHLGRDYASVIHGLKRSRKRFTLVLPNDYFAALFMQAAREQGLACPRDFNLISFGNDERYHIANMTTVAPPTSHLGQVMGKLLHDSRQPSNAMVHTTLKSVIIERSTCDFSRHGVSRGKVSSGND